ncbi:MAG: ABC transporter ATP-binding protein [Lautropia sp.]
MATVEFRRLVKRYGEVPVVHGIDLQVADGEFVVLVGPSGCGKSTCLRMLAGLEDVSDGEILIDGSVVNEIDAAKRDIAMVFQDYALYPHMSVFENIAFSLRYRGVKQAEIAVRVADAARVLGLGDLLDRRPKELSGGQRQRVAMGRAIVRKPRVFLFDEPLSNLDAKLRGQMRLEIKRLHRQFGITTVYVTHDQVEAMTLADRVVVMRAGRIEQAGTPDEVYRTPRTRFVAGFIGAPTMNLLEVRRSGDRIEVVGSEGAALAGARATPDAGAGGGVDAAPRCEPGGGAGFAVRMPIPATAPLRALRDDAASALVLGVRPEAVSVAEGPAPEGTVDLAATVDVIEALGPDTLVFARIGAQSLVARVPPALRPEPGETIVLRLDMRQAHLFDADSGMVIN